MITLIGGFHLRILISPAKTMRDFTFDGKTTMPAYLDKTKRLWQIMNKLDQQEIKKLCKVSDKLAIQSMSYFKDFCMDDFGIPALYAYHGIQFKALHPLSFDRNDIEFAQSHLRILSGMYGSLRPLDIIYPYRLEMQAPLIIDKELNLYSYWQDTIMEDLKDELIIDLASQEYSKVIHEDLKKSSNYIRVEFFILHNGVYKAISTQIKAARGLMVNWIIKQKIIDRDLIKLFHESDYSYCDDKSNEQLYVFVKD